MTTTLRTAAARLALAAALLGAFSAAHAGRTRIGIGLNFGFPAYGYGYGDYGWRGHGRPYYGGYGPYWGGYYGGGVVVAAPPPIIYAEPASPPVVVQRAPLVAQAAARPDPVIYPRNGQDAQQTEYDRQQCNRWATTQPAAVADAAVFMRAIEACMDGRGYSVK